MALLTHHTNVLKTAVWNSGRGETSYQWIRPPAQMRLCLRPNCSYIALYKKPQASTRQRQATEILVQNTRKKSLKNIPN